MAKRRGSAGNKAAIAEEPAWPALPRAYRRACKLVNEGRYDDARRAYGKLEAGTDDPRLKALIVNDLAVLEALNGNLEAARAGLQSVLTVDDSCEPALGDHRPPGQPHDRRLRRGVEPDPRDESA